MSAPGGDARPRAGVDGAVETDVVAEALEDAQDPGVTDHRAVAAAPPGAGGDTAGSGSMSGRIATGASWSAVATLGGQVIQFGASLVLARLLSPGDYGTMASVYVITGFAILFFELGLSSAVIALRDPTERDLSTAFWINALGGVVFTALLAAAGPLVATLFDNDVLRLLTPVVGLTFLFGLGSVHNALLQRQLRFKTIAVISVASSVLGLATTVTLAALGVGVYSLAIGPIVTSAAASVMSWSLVPWRPTSFISGAAFRRLWRFSGGQLGFNVVNYWGRNADNFIIARWVGAASLGFYNKAYSLMLLPVQQVSGVLGRVMFPALAAMKDDHERVAAGYRRALRVINVITVPVLVGMAATAPGLVPLLWGDQWLGAVSFLIILSLAGVPQCLVTSVGWLYQSQNRTARMFRMGLITSGLGIVLMIVGLWVDGARGVAWAIFIREWAFVGPQLHYAGSLVDLRARRVIRDGAPVVLVSAAMFVFVWSAPSVLGMDRAGVAAVVVQVLVGVTVYVLGVRLFVWETARDLLATVLRRRGAV